MTNANKIAAINNRIDLLRSRSKMANNRIINKLERKKRAILAQQ